jgi:hypothetical protein
LYDQCYVVSHLQQTVSTMFEKSVAVALPSPNGFSTQRPQSRKGRGRSHLTALGAEGVAAEPSRAAAQCRFLSEAEAAAHLGLSTARMTFMRNFDLAIIRNGGTPYGPPPLCVGGTWRYARENVEEWLRSRGAVARDQGPAEPEPTPVRPAEHHRFLRTGTDE